MFEGMGNTARTIADSAGASVVRLGGSRGRACAVIVSDRHLVANAHSVDDQTIPIRTSDGRQTEATVIGLDHDGDLAVLEAEEPGPSIDYSDTEVVLGTPVFAVGVAGAGPRVTMGLVSAVGGGFRGPRGRRIDGTIEHTAPLAPGSSGSALVDVEGRLLGINTSQLGRGFYVALPADRAFRDRIRQLVAGERIERPRLGIAIAPPWVAHRMRAAVGLPSRDGLLVREVEAETPAAAAGLAVGDLLIEVNDHVLTDPDDLAAVIDAGPASLHVTLLRGETEMTLPVQLRAG